MLIRATGPLHVDFLLLTLGQSCHYAVSDDSSFSLFDPGLSVHVPFLVKRLIQSNLPLKELQYVFLTHLHADRVGGLPYLRKLAPHLKVAGSPLMRTKLASPGFVKEIYEQDRALSSVYGLESADKPMSFDEYKEHFTIDKVVVDSDIIRFHSEIGVRVVNFPGHAQESLAYIIQPYRYLLADEGLGYYNGRKLAAPGGDTSLTQNVESLSKFNDLDIAGLCCPSVGVITGNLVRKHIQSIVQNTADLISECKAAFKSGIPEADMQFSIRESFYTTESADPTLRHNYERSFNEIWKQLAELKNAPDEPAEAPETEKPAKTAPSVEESEETDG